jgi:hypothetical protein
MNHKIYPKCCATITEMRSKGSDSCDDPALVEEGRADTSAGFCILLNQSKHLTIPVTGR